MKQCSRCGVEKPLAEFYFHKVKNRHLPECDDCRRARNKAWRLANVDRVRAVNREWQRANPERVKAAMERWKQRHPGKAARAAAVWFKANRERALATGRRQHRELKVAAYAAYGGFQCACCGEETEAFLSLDHVNNDGAEHRRTTDRRNLYRWLRDNGYPDGFQVLCMNCNFGKARNGGICPHQVSEGSTTIPKGSRAKWPQARGSR